MYYFMNKDDIVAFLDKKDNIWKLQYKNGALPAGNFEINEWLEDRKALKHNNYLKQLMLDCGCENTEGFIKITHAASINDCYWVKSEKEQTLWNNISFYRNEFDETISKLAFEGLGLYGYQISSTSPELTTDGSFRKCWRRENGEIYLYKRGKSGAFNAGLEPYCEMLASEIIQKADPQSVRYQVVKLHKEIASKCKSFTNEEIGLVPLRRLISRNSTLEELLQFFDRLECREDFQRMLVLDAVIFNVDRHLGNIGVLVNNQTQELLRIAPNFDFNLAMLPYVTQEEFDDIGQKLLDYAPKIGNDFTRIAQKMLTSKIRKELIDLQGFQFSFQGNKDFAPWRVNKMEQLVAQQITAILKNQILYTKDVFIPQTPVQELTVFDNTIEHNKAEVLVEALRKQGIFSSVMEEIDEDNHISVRATFFEAKDIWDIVVQMEHLQIFCEKNGIKVPLDAQNGQPVVFYQRIQQTQSIIANIFREYFD